MRYLSIDVVVLALLAVFMALPMSGCCGPESNRITRDRDTYVVEVFANLARQNEASEALLQAAEASARAGDVEACEGYAEPALLIQAKAQAQAWRALWLAGQPYPLEDGSLPPEGEPQPDPGPAGDPVEASNFCQGFLTSEESPGETGSPQDEGEEESPPPPTSTEGDNQDDN